MNLLRRFFLLSTLLVPSFLLAQTTGTIQGTVTDSTGAVVDSATVTATNLSTNATRTATTSASGFLFDPEPRARRVHHQVREAGLHVR